jgi:hypothetical protein
MERAAHFATGQGIRVNTGIALPDSAMRIGFAGLRPFAGIGRPHPWE